VYKRRYVPAGDDRLENRGAAHPCLPEGHPQGDDALRIYITDTGGWPMDLDHEPPIMYALFDHSSK
jgi:hypothetical protein